MSQCSFLSNKRALSNSRSSKYALMGIALMAAVSAQADPTVTTLNNNTASGVPVVSDQSTQDTAMDINDTLAAQLQPSKQALSSANQELLSRNAQLQRQVNDLQTQVNVLVYESKGQLFLYGAFTVLISVLVGIFISWLVFVRRERW